MVKYADNSAKKSEAKINKIDSKKSQLIKEIIVKIIRLER